MWASHVPLGVRVTQVENRWVRMFLDLIRLGLSDVLSIQKCGRNFLFLMQWIFFLIFLFQPFQHIGIQ
jgi:hypothetical protein